MVFGDKKAVCGCFLGRNIKGGLIKCPKLVQMFKKMGCEDSGIHGFSLVGDRND